MMHIICKYNIQIHRDALVLILYALLSAKSKWKKIKLEYKQLMKCFFGFFCQKVTGQGEKPMLLFPFFEFHALERCQYVYTSMHVYVCMSDLLEWQGRK